LLDSTGTPITGDYATRKRTHRTNTAKTKTYGGVYHAFPWFSLRYNKSESRELANVNVRLIPLPDAEGKYKGSRFGDNPEGRGEDYGFDLNLFDSKINLRFTKFETSRAGAQGFGYGGANSPTLLSNRVLDGLETAGLITTVEAQKHRLEQTGATFDVDSSGEEYELTANPTKNWRLSFKYSHTKSVTDNVAPEIQEWARTEIPWMQQFNQSTLTSANTTIATEIARWQTENAEAQSVEGIATVGNRPDKFSVVTRYSFSSGLLKGFHAGGGVSHQGKMVVGASSTDELVHGPSYTTTNGFLGYKFGRRLKYLKNVSVQLNVYNLLDNRKPIVTRWTSLDNPTSPSRMMLQQPRYWRLSADLAF
jgi:hypothetical protein